MTNILLLQNLIKLTAEIFELRSKRANLVRKTDFDNKLSMMNQKIISNKAKHLLVANELKKLQNI